MNEDATQADRQAIRDAYPVTLIELQGSVLTQEVIDNMFGERAEVPYDYN